MADFKFNPDLFLEVQELERFKDFLDIDGFRKNILENSVNFGLIKSYKDKSFLNSKVERDSDISGNKTIKISSVEAINNSGQFIYSSGINNVVIPLTNQWFWVKIKHQYSTLEKGSVSLAINGDLVGVGTEFTKILRGMPNFPSRIKFSNSLFNTLEYDILEVIDDTHAIVAHPASSGTGVATFNIEENLQYSIVGTFTPGVAIPTESKYPFRYDSVDLELVQESITNTRPTYIVGQEFYVARLMTDGTNVLIQDKRIEYWETKGSSLIIEEEVATNPLIGIEAIKWQNSLSPANKNEVYVAWGMRSQNWSIDASRNIVTLYGSSLGGRFKAVDNFTNGDFDKWRIYTANGNYSRITSSTKQGQAINLTLDVLDVDNYSDDGGLTFNSGVDWVLIVPDCEEVSLRFKANNTDSVDNVDKTYTFPVNILFARCDLEVYKDPSCLYNVKYRYKTFKNYTEWSLIPDDSVGYFTETSFDSAGNLKSVDSQVLYPYIGNDLGGFIRLSLSPNSYSRFKGKVFLGDVLGIKTITTNFDGSSVYDLEVGFNEKYQYFTGNISLTNNLYISLSDANATAGNTFKLHFKGNLTLGNYKIYVVKNYATGTPVIIKTIEAKDVVEMNNRLDGIVIDFTFNDLGTWDTFYQNYDYLGSVVKLTGDQTIQGVKTFQSSPVIPAPTANLQAATKKYVDDSNRILTAGNVSVGDVAAPNGTSVTITFSQDIGTSTYYVGGSIKSRSSDVVEDSSVTWSVRSQTSTGFVVHFQEQGGSQTQNISFDYIVIK